MIHMALEGHSGPSDIINFSSNLVIVKLEQPERPNP